MRLCLIPTCKCKPAFGRSFAVFRTPDQPVRQCATFTAAFALSHGGSVVAPSRRSRVGRDSSTMMCCGSPSASLCGSLCLWAHPYDQNGRWQGPHCGSASRRMGRLVKDAHVGYITWEDFERNEAQLAMNSQAYAPQRFSPPREGPALLQGLIICGRCGERMTVRYHQRGGQRIVPDYLCQSKSIEQGRAPCQRIPGSDLDRAIGALLAERVTPEAPGPDAGRARGARPARRRSAALAPSAGRTGAV